jgi:hypothetical protein
MNGNDDELTFDDDGTLMQIARPSDALAKYLDEVHNDGSARVDLMKRVNSYGQAFESQVKKAKTVVKISVLRIRFIVYCSMCRTTKHQAIIYNHWRIRDADVLILYFIIYWISISQMKRDG